MAEKRDDEPRAADGQTAMRMDLMEQARALQFLARQAEIEAVRLPEKRLDELHAEPLTQVFEVLGPDGKVMRRVNANGDEVKAK